MATMNLDPGTSYSDQTMGSYNSYTRRPPLFAAIRWGAVLAGVAVGLSMQLILSLLGVATGLSSTDITQGESIGAGPLLWAGVSMLIAAFIGGYVAARMSGLKRKGDGVLHGIVSWAVTTLLFTALATSAGGSMLNGVFGALNPAGGGSSSGSGGGAQSSQSSSAQPSQQSSSQSSSMLGMLKGQLGNNVDPAALQTLQQHIQAGRRDEAIQYMGSTMGIDPAKAAPIVDQALILSGSPQQASPQARATADKAVHVAGAAAWTVFGAAALSLLFGIGGGALGAVGARRVTWTETTSEEDSAVRERVRS